jgi:DNA-binding NarL/FixJ family response regulator
MSDNNSITIDEFYPNSVSRTLMPYQAEIVTLVALDFSNKAIADKLNVTLSTVKNQKQNLFSLASAKSSIELLNSMLYL